MANNNLMKQPSPLSNRGELRALLKQYLKEGGKGEKYTWESLTTENGLPHNWIYDLYQAKDGQIFVGTWGGGLTLFNDGDMQVYTKNHGLHSNAITCICEDQQGIIWVATDEGLNIYDDGRIKDGGLAGKSLLNLAVDRKGRLWAGCWRAATSGGGLFRWDGFNWQSYTTRDGLPGNEILKVFEDSKGKIWIGTYEHGLGAGVGCYDGNRWTNYTEKDGLINDCVYAMFEDPSGNMWFGTTGGVSIFDRKTWHSLTTEDGLIDNRVYCMFIDRDHKMWFGTENGISRFDGENWLSFTTKDGLVDNLVRTIMETREGDLWFGTYPYARGNGGISIAKRDKQKRLVDRVLDYLPEPPSPDQLPSGET
jgi:ligand-binding sensor domain-containing protein